MTRDGFEALAQAYGGDMARWPQDHWDEAALFAAQQPDLAAGVLAAAARLDEALDAWAPLAVSIATQRSSLGPGGSTPHRTTM
ncbi:hypothetical protein [Phenylobacterium sp.]|uniref:hypothetical protein n=1 Tax=Phenylobacterium sp. TaxID=1871053 RepID=UPI0035B3A681